MPRRRVVASAAGLCIIVAGVSGLLAGRAQPAGPLLASVPIGTGRGLNGWLPIDTRAGRAYLLDDGVVDRVVTLDTSGGYSWPPYDPLNTSVHVIDTRNGRLLAALPVSDSTENVFVDADTQRLFTFDPSNNQIQVYDTRHERLVGSLPWNTMTGINALLIDPRGGRVIMATNGWDKPAPQHVLLLDGYSGHVLHTVAFPHGPAIIDKRPGIIDKRPVMPSTAFPPNLSMTLDERSGHLYVFDGHRRMSVLDGVSGRLLYTRRLRVAVLGAQIDERTGRIFAFDATHSPVMTGETITQTRRLPVRLGSIVMLDARSGAILRRIPGGNTRSGAESLAIDQGTNHVLVANWLNGAVSVLDGASGAVLHTITIAVGAVAWQIIVDARHHRAVVAIGTHTSAVGHSMGIVDTRTGALSRVISLKWNIDSLAVDPASGHILVTTSALLPVPGDRWGWLPSWLRDHLPGLPPPASTPDPPQRLLRTTVITLDPTR